MSDYTHKPRVGSLTGKIEIQERLDTLSPTGAVVTAWVTKTTTDANLYEMFGKEFVAANQRYSQATTVFTMRHSSNVTGVNTAHRIIFNGVTYNIVGFDRKPLVRPRWLTLYAYSADGVEVQA